MPRICHTASAFLIYQSKIILVKHKKLGLWLAPGGHFEANEQPHQTAARECFEETGNQVEIISAFPIPVGKTSQYLPMLLLSTCMTFIRVLVNNMSPIYILPNPPDKQ